jgi:hypothetical protein
MLDHGFASRHKYYYCGDQVTAEPEYIDDGLARFKYTFPDGCEYTLNMFPLRKNYVLRLMRDAGFERVRTYGDFQETYQENEPDFFIHVAEKSVTSDRQLRDRRNPLSHRRYRQLERSIPIAGDVMAAARLDQTRTCTTDESVMRNGH